MSWRQRQIVTSAEYANCASIVLTVRVAYLDGYNGNLAETTFDHGRPVQIVFDSAEFWYTGTSSPSCGLTDFWGTAAHEVGHVWGLHEAEHDAGLSYAPEGEPATMSNLDAYDCVIRTDHVLRTLSSDDEAGIDWEHYTVSAASPKYMPNFSFERTQDCSNPSEGCLPDFYWALSPDASRFTRVCGDGNAYVHNCYERLTSGGTFIQKVARRLCDGFGAPYCSGRLSIYANNRGPGSISIRLQVLDRTGGGLTILADQNLTLGVGRWRYLSINFNPISIATQRLYEFRIVKGSSTEGVTVWFDNFQVNDLVP